MNYQFFLGGYDLEMLTIKELLLSNGYTVSDKELKWGAKLSDYQDEIDSLKIGITPVFIELEQDIQLPSDTIIIDHHGEYSDKKSSLEQIAELLNIKLTRHQELVAVNDKGYISGMRSLCATDDEIKQIRMDDRIAQGATEDDEEFARKSIRESDESPYIYSYTPHFSAVSDLAYKKHSQYVIYDDKKIVFYGYEIEKVKTLIEKFGIKKSDFYYGGGEFGFLGINSGCLNEDTIKKVVEECKLLNKEEEIYSYHTFMLPFMFDLKDKKDILEGWEFERYKDNYNEIAYFHSFFRESMFVKEEADKNSAFYTKNEYKNSSYVLCKSKEYRLNLKSVNLRLFKTGIGILSFHLENKTHPEVKAILEINDFGRRIYPEYLDYKKEFCGLVPNYVKMGTVEEKFEFDKNHTKPKLSKLIQALLPIEKIAPAVDDRMFVMSFYKNKEIALELKDHYVCHDKWYEYIFIDGDGKTIQNVEMQKELTQKATYARWQQRGTMYGMSKYSFVCLSDSDFPLKHMQTMYFQMFSLLLMVRASILKFSGEVSKIADEDISQDVSDIYKRYIQFVNNFYFREITAKDQGIEIYDKAIELLKIERDVKDLDNEIAELFSYADMTKQAQINEAVAKLSAYGIPLMVASLIAGIFGMNPVWNINWPINWPIMAEAISVIIGGGILYRYLEPLMTWISKIKKGKNE